MSLRAVAAALVAGIASVVLVASPASAHTSGGGRAEASNYRSTITDVTAPATKVTARVIDAGDRVEVTNRTAQPLIVLGYQGEPYLRLDAEGVFVNRRSPATYLNADRFATTAVPPDADPDAPPDWRLVDRGSTARWHDHRAHWMSQAPPPTVAANPDRTQTITEWTISLVFDTEPIELRGTLAWVPAPSPLPWYAGAVLGAVLIALAGLWRHWRAVLVPATAILVSSVVMLGVGMWWATTEPGVTKVNALALPTAVIVGAVLAVIWSWGGSRDALLLTAVVGAAVAALLGVANFDWLNHSQLPTGLEPTLARATVATSFATGVGVFGMALLRLRLTPASPRTEVEPGAPIPSAGRHRAVLLAIAATVVALVIAF